MSAISESLSRLSSRKDIVYPNLAAVKKAGFTSVGAGLLLRSASETETEVWRMDARDDGQIQILQAPQYGYAPILLPRDVDRKVIASSDDAVETPYGNGKQVGKTKDGSPIVEIMSRRYVMASDQVRRPEPKVEKSIRCVAHDPTKTPVTTYIRQAAEEGKLDEQAYLAEAYGDPEYARQLTQSMGATSEHRPPEEA